MKRCMKSMAHGRPILRCVLKATLGGDTLYLCHDDVSDENCISPGEKRFLANATCRQLGYSYEYKSAQFRHDEGNNWIPGEHGQWGDATGGSGEGFSDGSGALRRPTQSVMKSWLVKVPLKAREMLLAQRVLCARSGGYTPVTSDIQLDSQCATAYNYACLSHSPETVSAACQNYKNTAEPGVKACPWRP